MMKVNHNGAEFWCLLVGAVIAWLAVLLQYYLILDNRVESVVETTIRFFSYFTILTNSLVALCFTVLCSGKVSRLYSFVSRAEVLTAVSIYILVVGLVYQIVLRANWDPTGLQRVVDELLHSVIPVYFLAYWFLFVPRGALGWKVIPFWLVYPLTYLVYILIRGAYSGFYPYPFVDLNEISSGAVVVNAVVLLGLFGGLSVGFVWLSRRG